MASKTSVQRDDFSYGTPVEEVQPSRDSKIVVALLAMQSVVLIALLAGGLYAYRELQDKTDRIEAVVTIVEDPSKLLNQPQLVQSLVGLMQNTTSAFFFGDADGAIPSFVNNLMLFDFGPWGTSIANFASDVTNTFQVNSNSSLCNQWVSCTPNTQVQCSDGSLQFCNWNGQVNCAPVSTCVAPSIVTGASLVGSVAERFSEWKSVSGTTDGTAAFSNGLFRLDLLLEWVRSQMNSPKWQNAGMTCESFVRQVRAINWNGTYFDTNNQAQSWDANSQVSQISNYVEQVCNGLQDLAQQKEQQQQQQPKSKAVGAAKHGAAKVVGVKANKPQQHSHKGKH